MLVPADAWLTWFIGADELQVLEDRGRYFSEGEIVGENRRWTTGTFNWPSITELREQVDSMAPIPGASVAELTVVDGVDIGQLQASMRTQDRAMVQLASNFNCLENPSRSVVPDHGYLVEGYACDATQGPAASFGVPAAALFRAHYPFHTPEKPPAEWGQTASRQIELLADVRDYFGTCVNGKATLNGNEEPLVDVALASDRIRVGLHEDCEVVFGRGQKSGQLEVLPEPFAVVDQVLSASLNWRSLGTPPTQPQLETLTRAALRASYNGAYLSAIRRGRRLLLLTLVGGGVFANPPRMIFEELAAAHMRWATHPASELREARVCLFEKGRAPEVRVKLRELMAA